LDLVFNLGPYPIYGDTDTVCQTSMMPHLPYEANLALPSYRQIVDLSDFNRSVWVLPPGQSGQIGSVNYGDQVQSWMEGQYFPMPWDRVNVEQLTAHVLWLKPTV
jgi:penicillin amidase